jgi:hypothetical protein
MRRRQSAIRSPRRTAPSRFEEQSAHPLRRARTRGPGTAAVGTVAPWPGQSRRRSTRNRPLERGSAARGSAREPSRPSRATRRRASRHVQRNAYHLAGFLPCRLSSARPCHPLLGAQSGPTPPSDVMSAPWAIAQRRRKLTKNICKRATSPRRLFHDPFLHAGKLHRFVRRLRRALPQGEWQEVRSGDDTMNRRVAT